MAAIATFVSYDGGVAFSEDVMKIQKRGRESVTIPLEDVATIWVKQSQEDLDGFIRIETESGKRYRIFFEDEREQEAQQFRKRFNSFRI